MRAFVIMPFHPEFDYVYESFIRPIFESAGFEVTRADEIQSQQNILKDIVAGIESADVVVADLSDANPNVFYELGVAHGLYKRVILLTQKIDDVPFDLRTYRLIHYDTHFGRIDIARSALRALAEKVAVGELRFGNPVSDFGATASGTSIATWEGGLHQQQRGSVGPADVSANEKGDGDSGDGSKDFGFLDHLLLVGDGYERLTEVLEVFTRDANVWNEEIDRASREMNALREASGSVTPRSVMRLTRRLADRTGDFNSSMETVNSDYTEIAQDMEDSLEFVVSFQLANPQANREELAQSFETWESAKNSGLSAKTSVLAFVDTMRNFPRIESRLNREIDRSIELMERFAGNIDGTVSAINRALAVWEHDRA